MESLLHMCSQLLEAMDIDNEDKDNTMEGWKQLHMMFEGKDFQALQSLIKNGTITSEDLEVIIRVIDAIQTTMQ